MSGATLMILAVTCFAVTHASVKFLQAIPFYEIVFFRALISLVICFVSLRMLKIPLWGKNKKLLLWRGAFGTLALILYFYTLQTLPLATAVTIQYLSPMLTILLSQWLLKESASPLQWVFFVMAFIGGIMTQDFHGGDSWVPLVAGLSAALASAVAYNFIRMLADSEHELVVVLYFPLVTLPLMAPVVAWKWVTPLGWDWLGLVVVGVFTQLAQVFMTKSLQKEPAANVSLYNYLGIVYAMIVGWLLFDEIPGVQETMGIGLIVVSMVLSAFTRWKRRGVIFARK